jgi:ABC-type branched-subunit amino acid transport system ATPase component
MLEARDLTLKFGGVTALSDVSVDIGHQELVALIGPNGAGKELVAERVVASTARARSSVHFEGQDIAGWRCTTWRRPGWRAPSGHPPAPAHERARQAFWWAATCA